MQSPRPGQLKADAVKLQVALVASLVVGNSSVSSEMNRDWSPARYSTPAALFIDDASEYFYRSVLISAGMTWGYFCPSLRAGYRHAGCTI